MDDYSAAAIATTIDTATKVLKSVCGAPTNEYDLQIAKINAISGTVITVACFGAMVWMAHELFKSASVEPVTVTTNVTKPNEEE